MWPGYRRLLRGTRKTLPGPYAKRVKAGSRVLRAGGRRVLVPNEVSAGVRGSPLKATLGPDLAPRADRRGREGGKKSKGCLAFSQSLSFPLVAL